ncbi:halocyanin [Haladaptatus sp. W1]|uniref:plastocyanin/azurin family copper-binding protein n=1 Tax=Haladaptatus sp. W1 TaxID=1897478 RepID=UPI000849B6BB|nr:plastocyanin/azurin family copper-binding protein [Haladaptatus sp. W1]ODR79943.1 halocyanin [Haladaptatus sp. W1]
MTGEEGDTSVTRRGFLFGSTGVVAAGATGASGTAAAQNESGGNQSGGNASGGGGGGPTQTVQVGPGGDLVFDPDSMTISPGTTLEFVWDSDNHNIFVESQPDGGNWDGTPGGQSKVYNTGYTYSHTFNTEGDYEYYCVPHKSAGMTGSITVGAASGPSEPAISNDAKTLGIATTGALAFTLGIGYFFLKYGGDYGES